MNSPKTSVRKAGRFFYRLFVRDFWLKLVALMLAFLFWRAVANDPQAETTINVPLELHRIPDGLEISSETISEVQLRLRGAASKIRELRPREVHVELDLANTPSGEHTFELTPRQAHPPSGIEVLQVLPAQYRISLDRHATKMVEVRPHVLGTFASDRHIAQVMTDPMWVKIAGPAHRLAEVESASTDPIDASGTMARETFVTRPYVADPLVQISNPQPIRVTVVMQEAGSGSVPKPPHATTAPH